MRRLAFKEMLITLCAWARKHQTKYDHPKAEKQGEHARLKKEKLSMSRSSWLVNDPFGFSFSMHVIVITKRLCCSLLGLGVLTSFVACV